MTRAEKKEYLRAWREAHPFYHRNQMRKYRGRPPLDAEHWPRRKMILGAIVNFSKVMFQELNQLAKRSAA